LFPSRYRLPIDQFANGDRFAFTARPSYKHTAYSPAQLR
jgi:hypothetical protein